MSVAEMQACLARLYVDESFRKLFFSEPEKTLLDYRMTADERAAISNIDRKMLDFFAVSLINKRKEHVERAFPVFSRLHPELVDYYYRRYYRVQAADPHEAIDKDTVRFGMFLEESMADAADVPAYASQLARYECLSYWVNIGPRMDDVSSSPQRGQPQSPGLGDRLTWRPGVRMESFSYDVAGLCADLDRVDGNGSGQPLAGDNWILFIPADDKGADGKMMRVNYPTSVLVELCDGVHTVAQVISQVEETLGAAPLEQALREPIDHLLSAGAIEVVRT